MIKGSQPCVCFSEAPLSALQDGLIHPAKFKQKYAPFGFMVRKDWLFEQGGRPVIYQSDSEFHLLPESMQWRHVRYEPPKIDFTWEREWRIKREELPIDPDDVKLVFPNGFAKDVVSSWVQEYKYDLLGYQSPKNIAEQEFDPEHPYPEDYFETDYWDDGLKLEAMFPDFSEWEAVYIDLEE